MCFGSKDKHIFDDDAPRPAPGQFPQQPTYADSGPKASMPRPQQQQHQQHQQQQNYHQPPYHAPPPSAAAVAAPGPPAAELSAVAQSNPPVELPSTSSNGDYAPPPGPPPSHQRSGNGDGDDGYAPPPGPPPSHAKPAAANDDLSYVAPPPGPPPGMSSSSEKPKHEWEVAVPDTSLFPPPPAIFSGWYRSPAQNATEEEAEAGERWCAQFPLAAPLSLDAAALAALRASDIRLMAPQVGFRGRLAWSAPGVWSGATDASATDSCIIGYPPLYAVKEHSPLATGRARTIYYEVAIAHHGTDDEVCLALGFTALPYPSFRMPGWHRGSLAVHGDDGHRFVNDRWGGKSFTEPFRRGETCGIGMTFRPGSGGGAIETEVFFTRGGRVVGDWNLHEETDAHEDMPVTGLEGYHDLSCAIGAYKAVTFDIIFDPARWAYQPPQV